MQAFFGGLTFLNQISSQSDHMGEIEMPIKKNSGIDCVFYCILAVSLNIKPMIITLITKRLTME